MQLSRLVHESWGQEMKSQEFSESGKVQPCHHHRVGVVLVHLLPVQKPKFISTTKTSVLVTAPVKGAADSRSLDNAARCQIIRFHFKFK